MSEAILFALDDDPQVLRAVGRDLRARYRGRFRILSTTSPREALDSLPELRNQGETVALFLSDNRMPEMEGVDFLERARGVFPEARRVLLTAYSDTEAAIKAINEVHLDYYLLKPWDPPEERLYPVLDDLLEAWEASHVPPFRGIRVIGHAYSPPAHALKDVLAGNLVPYRWLEVQGEPEAREVLGHHGLGEEDLPVVVLEDGRALVKPGVRELAQALGLRVEASADLYDVAIVGAGPAGLGAAVYAASEGLKTLLIDRRGPGGQAGTSSRIENYLGFPNGLSGAELTRRAVTQATRFGTEFLSPQEVAGIELNDPYKTLRLQSGAEVHARSVVITTGVNYRTLDAPGVAALTGAGVYYGAANTEAAVCTNRSVMIVGGGNSAGQAAMYLSQVARRVILLIRRESLDASMSSYLIEQIEGAANIELWTGGEVAEARGEGALDAVVVAFRDGRRVVEEMAALFVFIGAQAVTRWVPPEILTDARGFLLTGTELRRHPEFRKRWKQGRDPHLLETSIPGVFASGDVRSGAMNRVASAVGEGAMSISFVHRYLAEL